MIWQTIVDYPNYEVSSSGLVKNVTTGRILKPWINNMGYELVSLCKPGTKPKHRLVHTLVGKAFIANPDNKPCLDHINGDIHDNRVENLRWATHSENQMNMAKPIDNSSGYKGVSWHKGTGKWQAGIRQDGKSHHLGLFTNIEDAAAAYDQAAIEIFGEFARVNPPQTPKTKIVVKVDLKSDYVSAAEET